MTKKKEVMFGFEDGVMKVESWKTGKTLWWMKVGGGITHKDVFHAAYAWVAKRGYIVVDTDPEGA